jgi:hypothetical protein
VGELADRSLTLRKGAGQSDGLGVELLQISRVSTRPGQVKRSLVLQLDDTFMHIGTHKSSAPICTLGCLVSLTKPLTAYINVGCSFLAGG